MKVFILVTIIHLLSMAEGIFIYHQFFMKRAEEMMYEILLDEIHKMIVEIRSEKI